MSVAVNAGPAESAWTIDELAMRVGMTVRTTRYYASLGLLPTPERRGRIAYYDDRHRVRLEIIRTMQDRGFSLAGIEQQLAQLEDDTPVADLEIRRSMLNSWAPSPPEVLTREGLDLRAGRRLTDAEVEQLTVLRAIRAVGESYEVMPIFDVSIAIFEIDIPSTTIQAASDIISESMHTMVARLGSLMRRDVIEPFRAERRDPADAEAFERTVRNLQQLTLDAVIGQFQVALHELTETGRGSSDDLGK